MPAKKKPAPKAPAKPAKKAPAKPALKKPAQPVKSAPVKQTKPAKPAPKKSAKAAKPAPTPKAKTPVVKKVVKPVSKKSPPPVKKAPAKAAPPAKKPAAKKAPAKPAPAAKKPAAKAPAPAKKAPAPVKAAPAPKAAAKPEPAKKAAPAPAPAPAPAKPAAPAPVKAAPAAAKAPAKSNNGPTVKITNVKRTASLVDEGITLESAPKKPAMPAVFLKKQRIRLIELRDLYMNAAEGVANESLRNNDGNESAFGMHQADAGSDAYDRDFALSLLAKEQDAIYEINEALKRIDQGTYGICEMSGELISEERLEALPFTRFTVVCQGRLESEQRSGRWNRPVRSLFGLDESAEDADDDKDDEETSTTQSSNNGNESLDFSKE
jgi:RNA polymerase-binding transcription factor DksA